MLPVALPASACCSRSTRSWRREFPIANGAYQWSRRLLGRAYGWFNGWVALCAYAVANTTIAYLGAPWALAAPGVRRRRRRDRRQRACVFVVACSLVEPFGVDVLSRAVTAGIAAEAVASVGIGLTLLLVFRKQDWSILFDTLGAEALSGGSVLAAMLAALAVGGWVFIGFDACGRRRGGDPRRRAPRAAGDLDRAARASARS